MNETTHSMFTPAESRTMQKGLPLTAGPKPTQALTEKYRPSLLSEMVGQGSAVLELQAFVDFPYPQAFLFSGPTGIGKTTAAFALAKELGVNRDWNFMWCKSGELNDDAVTEGVKMLRMAGIGNGWKMIVCDEADKMSTKAKDRYLSLLEALQEGEYGKSVIIFTTNNAEAFEPRFKDRVIHLEFQSAPSVIGQDAQVLLNRLWIQEGLDGAPPSVERIPGVIAKDGGFPALSFRRVVRYVEQELRKPRNLRAEREAKIASADSITFEPRAFREMRKVSL